MKSILKTITMILLISLFSCGEDKELATVKNVSLTKYAGTWYEIARFPNSFEKGMDCVTATYTVLDNGKVEVRNKGRLVEKNNKWKDVKGKAWIPDSSEPGRLKVQFFWPFSGDYYIIDLAGDYSYSLVGSPSRDYLWVLCREKTLDKTTYDALLDKAKSFGFDTSKVEKINQVCS
jgi:apolipoprotein D and lipocalin family protein